MSVTKSKAPKSVHSYGGIVIRDATEAKKKKAKLNSCVPKPHPQPSEKTHLGQSSLWGHTAVWGPDDLWLILNLLNCNSYNYPFLFPTKAYQGITLNLLQFIRNSPSLAHLSILLSKPHYCNQPQHCWNYTMHKDHWSVVIHLKRIMMTLDEHLFL